MNNRRQPQVDCTQRVQIVDVKAGGRRAEQEGGEENKLHINPDRRAARQGLSRIVMKAVLPALARPILEPKLPSDVEVAWWSKAAEAKQMVVDAGPDDLVVSAAVTGTPASWLKASLRAAGQDPDNLGGPAERNYSSNGDPKRWRDIWAAGQGVDAVRKVEPLSQVVEQLSLEYQAAVQAFRKRTAGIA